MQRKWFSKNTWQRRSVEFLILTLVFGIAYTQSPLFTSNQNQYFLHGFSTAGIGNLDQDWLANTLDPTPAFSLIVALTQQYLQFESLYYLYYAVLMGIYLFSVLGIVSMVFDIRPSKGVHLLYLSLLIIIHSAALRFVFSRTLGVNWTYILEDGVADQRLLGPVFQPSSFGVLLVFSIYLFLRGRPYLAVLSATLAATVHPTYLLSAAVLTLAYMLLTYREQRRYLKPLLLGGLALLLVAPILYYVYSNFGGAFSEITLRAQDILVNTRIPHHARIDWWFDATAVVKICLVLSALYLVRNSRRLFYILLLLFLAASGLTVLQYLLDNNTLALIFPWRISTFLVPLSSALILGSFVSALATKFTQQIGKNQKALVIVSLAGIILVVFIGAVRLKLDFDRKVSGPDRPMMTFVADNRLPGESYLIPTKMQDFRLVTGAPAFVDFKSIPYRADDVLEWYRRIQIANRFYKDEDCGILDQLVLEDEVTHVILDRQRVDRSCARLFPVYVDDIYGVYKIRTE